MFDPYSSMNSLWTAVVVKFQTAGSCCGPKNGGPACGPACCHGIANLNLLSWNCQLKIVNLTMTKENCFGRPGPGRILDPIRTTAMCQALFETSQFREESDVD
jgi:hypothetical protein